MTEKDITMDDVKKQVEQFMDEYNKGKLSQKEASVLLKLAEQIRTLFKVEREYNTAKE